MTVFVKRDTDGDVVGVYAVPQYEEHDWGDPLDERVPIAVEELPDDDPEVVAFLARWDV